MPTDPRERAAAGFNERQVAAIRLAASKATFRARGCVRTADGRCPLQVASGVKESWAFQTIRRRLGLRSDGEIAQITYAADSVSAPGRRELLRLLGIQEEALP
jgi:hypothetical protein